MMALCASAVLMGGCSSTGSMPHTVGTGVSLAGNNYKVLKTGVSGKSRGFSLLGFIPIVSPNYAEAKANLYTSFGESLVGRSVALANQTQDRSSVYLVLFSIPTLTMTADVVEFDANAVSDGQ